MTFISRSLLKINSQDITTNTLVVNTSASINNLKILSDLDANNHRIINLAEPSADSDAINLAYLKANYYDKTYINNNYYTKTYIDDNFYTKTYIDNNFYTKQDIDSWNLIKNYTLASDLNANNYNINNVSTLSVYIIQPKQGESAITIQGDLNVTGNLTYVESQNLQVKDNIIEINSGETGNGVSLGTAGITIDRGNLPDAQIIWDESNDRFVLKLEDGTLLPLAISNLNTQYVNNAYPIPVSLNKGFDTAVTVTETTATLKQEVTPDNANGYLTYVEGIHIVANNPSGSGITLTFEVRALLDDNTETTLATQTVAEGQSFDDWLRWIYDVISNGKKIKSIRLYAYCSGTPASGSEPTVQLERVTGIQQ